jgi:LmbE family N-acetylglucosaminyl deacetylase
MFDRILILSPHTDDGEPGSGGNIARFVKEKKEKYEFYESSWNMFRRI